MSDTDGTRVRHITEMLLASLAHQHINDRNDRRRFLDAIDNLPDAAGRQSEDEDGTRSAIAAVRNLHRQGDLHNYGWNDAVAACLTAYDAAMRRPE